MDLMMEHVGHGLWLSLLLSMPAVILAAGIGLVVGILQAVTQVQEQTIAAAPKIVGVFLLIIAGGGLMMKLLIDFTQESADIAFQEIPRMEKRALPPREFRDQKALPETVRPAVSGRMKAVFDKTPPQPVGN